MSKTKFLTAAAVSAAILTTPTLAASVPVAADARTATATDEESQLFGENRRGGILALILIAAAIAIGVYIVVDDEEDEEPASP